ncbi:hypothetical protein [Brumicola nitratireducens]|uniref:Uncharacterized protein n=1 Tax=Glaciecola nitratireducens (strain JCM 12485 / KCTC 12276 / FR1064) TaxID=1085623 RepID=G4QG13_GLANF|nr:hypothetical protein [Glaciecola nitratireducens]AEP29104.1 hypothetical protein GNIT_0966 [Glaciecola nitratireducens FR1064]
MIRLLKWISRAWPVLGILPLFLVHYLFLVLPCIDSIFGVNIICIANNEINKVFALILQVLGGFLVLHSIDSNIGLFRNKNLKSLTLAWFKSFPFIKRKPLVIRPITAECRSEVHPIKIKLGRKADTLEEKIEALEEKLNWLKEDFQDDIKHLKKQIQNMYEESSKKYGALSNKTFDISTKLEKVSVGGIKFQVFGVSLLIYGSIVSYIA